MLTVPSNLMDQLADGLKTISRMGTSAHRHAWTRDYINLVFSGNQAKGEKHPSPFGVDGCMDECIKVSFVRKLKTTRCGKGMEKHQATTAQSQSNPHLEAVNSAER